MPPQFAYLASVLLGSRPAPAPPPTSLFLAILAIEAIAALAALAAIPPLPTALPLPPLSSTLAGTLSGKDAALPHSAPPAAWLLSQRVRQSCSACRGGIGRRSRKVGDAPRPCGGQTAGRIGAKTSSSFHGIAITLRAGGRGAQRAQRPQRAWAQSSTSSTRHVSLARGVFDSEGLLMVLSAAVQSLCHSCAVLI